MSSYNHDDFRSRSNGVFGVTTGMIALCTIFVFFRMVSRAWIVKKISIDDYVIVVAWAIAAGLSSAICYGCAWGLGWHERNIPFAWQEPLRKADYVFSVLYQPALMATKTSIIAFYLSLPTQNKKFKWACIVTLVVVNVGGFALGLFTVFQCRPIHAAWQTPIPSTAKCTDIITIYLSSTPLNIITDLAILFLPMPILTGMRLPKKQKIILIVTFSFGAFVAVVDVVRIVNLQGAAITRIHEIYTTSRGPEDETSKPEQTRTDFSWYASLSFMWSAIEVNVGIMCACVPGLKPLVSRFMPNLLKGSEDPSSRNASLVDPKEEVKMNEAQRVPSLPTMPDDVHRRDFSTQHGSAGEEDQMGMMEFLTTPNMGEKPDDSQMGMMDFLTTPDMGELPQATRTQTAGTNTSRHTAPAQHNFFDFVDMKGKKSIVHLTNRESLFPIAMVTILFFIWGFEYGLLDVLNQQFQRVAHMSAMQGAGIHSAYFAGYVFGPPLIGRLVLKHWGFKACYTVGLSIYGCGTLIFWPAAVLTSFPAFVITNFIVALGLSVLEVSANPFILLCGPPQYGEIRLNISQGVQAIGSIVAPLIANQAFFKTRLHTPSLINTQWAYLGISLFTILLAVAYYYVPLPEATDEELEEASERIDGANKAKIGNYDIIWITLAFGFFSEFVYVGGQEVNGTAFNTYFGSVMPNLSPSHYSAVAHTCFAASRFIGAGLGFFFKPRFLMMFYYTFAIIFEVLAMNYSGKTGTAMIMMTFFFEGPLFALIYGQSLRGMGRHTKTASVFLASAISGGAVFAPIASHLTLRGRPMYALVVAVAAFAGGIVFPIYLNANPLARKQCDPIKDATIDSDSRPSSNSSRGSQVLKILHIGKKRRDSTTNDEWRERKDNET